MRRQSSGQRGFALIVVMLLGAAAMYGVTSLIGPGYVVEKRAQEIMLLKMRAYWAAQGQISYVISRARQGPACGTGCIGPNDRHNYFTGIAAELDNSGAAREWSYPEVSASYSFPVSARVQGQAAFIRLELAYENATTTHPLIAENWPVRRDLWALICSGVAVEGDPCPNNKNGLDDFSSFTHLARMELK